MAKQDERAAPNPFMLSLEEQIECLRKANREEGWNFDEALYARLAATSPSWPSGRLAFRSIRIRFGEGDDGVEKTFKSHIARLERTFGSGFSRWKYPGAYDERLHLCAGNRSHQSTVEWITFELIDTDSLFHHLSDHRSIADEGLVFAWMFPEYVRAIDHDANPGFLLGGYSIETARDKWWWQDELYVGNGAGAPYLGTGMYAVRNRNSANYSVVPVLLDRDG